MTDSTSVVIASGYFDPIHVGHLDYLESAARLGKLIVVVNNDIQTIAKNGGVIFPSKERVTLIESLRCVSKAVLSIDTGPDISRTIEYLVDSMPKGEMVYFANGGDVGACREELMCRLKSITCLYGVGGADKTQSSSSLRRRMRDHPF